MNKSTGYMVLDVQLPNNEHCRLAGPAIEYWAADGKPTFSGALIEFKTAYPLQFSYLLAHGYIRECT